MRNLRLNVKYLFLTTRKIHYSHFNLASLVPLERKKSLKSLTKLNREAANKSMRKTENK